MIDGGNSYYRDDIDARERLADEGHPLRRRRHERRRVRARARLLPDDRRRPDEAVRAPRPDLRARWRPGVEAAARTPGRRRASRHAPSRATCTAGPVGAGHFVKMVHNGIEYGIMAAYAEGLNILQHAERRHGRARGRRRDHAAARSRVLPVRPRPPRRRRGLAPRQRRRLLAARPHRARRCTKTPDLASSAAGCRDSGEGRWTVQAAIDEGVPAPVLTRLVYDRFASRGDAATSPTRCCRPCARSSAATPRSRPT